ncbi:MAG: CehA/McbA family metallohydrolase [Phycisphaeraceae bacterium]|nr:CehA/McbA family metallohydrolase [Phycisphaeraceae bacterium]
MRHRALLIAFMAVSFPGGVGRAEPVAIDSKIHHLGNDDIADWSDRSTTKPEGKSLTVRFKAKANRTGPHTLQIHQENIHNKNWLVKINGKQVGRLKPFKGVMQHYLSIPAGVLKDGANTLSITNKRGWKDDILVGRLQLHDEPLAAVLQLGQIMLRVTDTETGRPVPARVTLVNAHEQPAVLYDAESEKTAVREGLIYVLGGGDRFNLQAGTYRFYATRGTEWSMAESVVRVEKNGKHAVELKIKREVATPGFVAADTHIHTLTHSGHGDSSVEERMVTLAGEGVELAIATDHNHNIDYRPTQKRMKLNDLFTSVVGNEVTTGLGHINSFPLNPKDPVPDKKLNTWAKLAGDIRAKGAQVTILNHPRWPWDRKSGKSRGPFKQQGFNPASGDFNSGTAFPFDGIEVINSETVAPDPRTDPLQVFHEWLALVNRGETVKAVGSSDSHTVGDPVGQGRTYLQSSTDDPAHLDVEEMVRSFKDGRSSISLGIITDLKLDRYGLGDLADISPGKSNTATVRVAAPSWVRPRRVMLLVNGVKVGEKSINAKPGRPTDLQVPMHFSTPAHDGHLVAAVIGDPVRGPYWRTDWPITFAATNPIWLDADGNGTYDSPRKTAAKKLAAIGDDLEALGKALVTEDPVIGVQMLSLRRKSLGEKNEDRLKPLLKKLAPTHKLYETYRASW